MCYFDVFLGSSVTVGNIFIIIIFLLLFVSKRNCSDSVLTASYLIPSENSDNQTHIQWAISGHFAQLTIMSQCQILFSFRRMFFNSNKRLKTSKQTPEFYLRISLSCVWPLWLLLLSPEGFLTQGTLHTHTYNPQHDTSCHSTQSRMRFQSITLSCFDLTWGHSWKLKTTL